MPARSARTRATHCSTSRSSPRAARTCSSSIGGVERLSAYADSIAPEAACTSVQLHQLVHPEDFAGHWNAAQAIAGIQLAVGANSPFFFGKELWRETRIALFEQATDTRPEELKAQGVRPRVWFGERWITSIFDLFEENVRYFPALLPLCDDEDPVAVLERGDTPTLGELRLHNGTVYRWNRPVYEVVRGRPHVRVENRALPAGPTVVDMLANAAFYYGLVRALVEQERPIWTQMSFSAAEDNLHAGAREGLDARVYWPGVGDVPVTELVLRRLLPLAHEGLERYGVDPHARDRLLEIIERRCVEEANGATWQSKHVPAAVRGRGPRPRRRAASDDGAVPRPHARQRAGPHLAARLTPTDRRGARRINNTGSSSTGGPDEPISRYLMVAFAMAVALLVPSATAEAAIEPPWCGTPMNDSAENLPDGTDPTDPPGSFPHIPYYAIGCTLEDIAARSDGRMQVGSPASRRSAATCTRS